MKVITKEIEKKLRANAKLEGVDYADLEPVVKLFQPDGAATMLLSTLDDDGVVQGVFDLGLGTLKWGQPTCQRYWPLRVVLVCQLNVTHRLKQRRPSPSTGATHKQPKH